MDLFEYQGKSLFARIGVPVPEGRVARTPEEARAAAEEIGGKVVVKAQVQVGGRGKAGGIKLADGPDEAFSHATDILGMDIKGHTVHVVWVEQASNIAAEYYVSFTLDRGVKKHLAIVSAQGGMDIEAVAADTPEAVVKMHIDPVVGLTNWQASELVYRAKLDRATARASAEMSTASTRACGKARASAIAIQPLPVPRSSIRPPLPATSHGSNRLLIASASGERGTSTRSST